MKSIVTEYENYCLLCGKPKECTHHLIGGNSKRKLSDEDGLFIPLCNECHNMAIKNAERIHGNPVAEKLSKILGQVVWEKDRVSKGLPKEIAREEFRKRYGISYL